MTDRKNSIPSTNAKFVNFTGQVLGLLTVVEYQGKPSINHPSEWLCLCDCGRSVVRTTRYFRNSKIPNCGGIAHRKPRGNQLRGTPCYNAWTGMKSRCYNPNNPSYPDYGGRGIQVCNRWHSFNLFFTDMGMPPNGHTLDRKNVDGDYERENCRWASHVDQANNRRNNHLLSFRGVTQSLSQWAKERGMSVSVLQARLGRLGWTVEESLTLPVDWQARRLRQP